MNVTIRNDKDPGQGVFVGTSNCDLQTAFCCDAPPPVKPRPIKKIERVIEAMKLPQGLNRFEAERIGEHCLNSTAAVIRGMYGDKLLQEWETVPTRYCDTGVRVLRYRLVGVL